LQRVVFLCKVWLSLPLLYSEVASPSGVASTSFSSPSGVVVSSAISNKSD
jgi:hypothetical protein